VHNIQSDANTSLWIFHCFATADQPFTETAQIKLDNKNAAANPNHQQWRICPFLKLLLSMKSHHRDRCN
jgi:hypothetical protein